MSRPLLSLPPQCGSGSLGDSCAPRQADGETNGPISLFCRLPRPPPPLLPLFRPPPRRWPAVGTPQRQADPGQTTAPLPRREPRECGSGAATRGLPVVQRLRVIGELALACTRRS